MTLYKQNTRVCQGVKLAHRNVPSHDAKTK